MKTPYDMRKQLQTAWHKHQMHQALSPLEQQICAVIKIHPEYHAALEDTATIEKDYPTDNNPFLHISLHLGVREQLTTQRPFEITAIYQTLCQKIQNTHEAEHHIMAVMADILWGAQQNNALPNESEYVERLKKKLT